MVLLVSAGLLLRSFTKLTSVNPGYEAKHVLKADVSLPRFQYSTPQQWSMFADQLMARELKPYEPGLQNSAMVVPAPHDQRPGVNLPCLQYYRNSSAIRRCTSRTAGLRFRNAGLFSRAGNFAIGRGVISMSMTRCLLLT